jgi:hypothetical protein
MFLSVAENVMTSWLESLYLLGVLTLESTNFRL